MPLMIRFASSLTAWAAGRVMTGASLTAVTVTVAVTAALVRAPSSARKETLRAPAVGSSEPLA